jgi:Mn2+/Fe2+ NRAMP family transporter
LNAFADLALGIMTALGGFVDIGELVFAVEGGARFQFLTLWVVALGTVGIIVYSEMSGRIAAVLHKPTFELIRESQGERRGLAILVASNLVNLLTCAAEIGGIAIVLQMFVGLEQRMLVLAAAVLLFLSIWFLEFRWIERVYGLLGLILLVYVATAAALQPDWREVARGLIPGAPRAGMPGWSVYAYFAVGLFSSVLMPYELYFYSSGGIEDNWTEKDLSANFLTSTVGFTLGGLLTMALIVSGAQAFFPRGIDPQVLSSSALPALLALGKPGLVFALLGMLFAIGGAAVETALASAYNLAQFFGWPWGKSKRPSQAKRFTLAWISMLVMGLAIAMSGVNPVHIVEYSVVFAVVVLPFTYYPILATAGDSKSMKQHVNSRFVQVLGWLMFALIVAAALAAVPLMYATHMGES